MGSNPIHAITPMAQWTTRSTSNRKIASSSLAGGVFFTRFSSKSSGRFESYTESAPVAQLAEHRSYEPKVTVSVLSASVLLIIHVLTSLGFEPRREHAEMV